MALPRAHELNEAISFINVTGPFNAATEAGVLSSTFATAYARITDMGGSLGESTQQNLSQTREYEVWTRWIDGVTGFMQMVWGSKRLVILNAPQKVHDGNGRAWWLIRAQEVTEQSL